MKKTTLAETVTEAERFLASARRLTKAYGKLSADDPDHSCTSRALIDLAAYTADVRRKSMDLTKALARLRKNE
mgnify:CR=1 FL=1